METTTNVNITSESTDVQVSRSFSLALKSETYPNKSLAIVIEDQEGISIKDYVSKIATIVNPTDIRFVSRISNNRICFFFSTQRIAEHIVNTHRYITINNQKLNLRPLINKHVRVVISNVCPVIPNESILSVLNKHGINPPTKISFIRAGISEPGFSHILSFRRQIYIDPDDIEKLPDSALISHEDTTYRIYFTTDNISCYLCKQEGHMASQCPSYQTYINNSDSTAKENQIASTNIEQSSTITVPPTYDSKNFPNLHERCIQTESHATGKQSESTTNEENSSTPVPPINVKNTPNLHKNFPQAEPLATVKQSAASINQQESATPVLSSNDNCSFKINKRGLQSESSQTPESLSTTSKSNTEETMKQPKKKKTKKDKLNETEKSEISNNKSLEELISPIKTIIENSQDKFPLTFHQFKSFLENSFNAADSILIAKDYSPDISSIIQMMTALYPHLTNKTIKGRFTRLCKKIKSVLPPDESSTESDSSADMSTK